MAADRAARQHVGRAGLHRHGRSRAARVIAAGSTNRSKTSQQGLLIKADTAGDLQPVSLAAIPGGLIPEETVNSTAVAGNEQIAVGSADGYPAVWRRVSDGPWALVSSLAQVSADPDLAGLSAVTHGPHGWLAAGPGLVLTSTDGTNWQPAGAITHDLAGVSAVQAASGPRGYVITGTAAGPGGAYSRDVWWSPDLTSWTRAHDVNETSGSNQVLAVAAGPSGFVSAGSHDNQPVVWTSPDGRTWTTVNPPAAAWRLGRGDPAGGGPREPRRRAGPADHRGRHPASRRAVRRRRADLAAGAVQRTGARYQLHRADQRVRAASPPRRSSARQAGTWTPPSGPRRTERAGRDRRSAA